MSILPDDVLPSGDANLTAYIAMMFTGFVVGVAGHIVKSNTLVATGIGLIFLGVLILPLLLHAF